MICFVWFRLFWSRVDWNQHVVDILFWRYMVVRSYSPLKLWFSFIFSPFLLNQKKACDSSVVINIFKNYPCFYIWQFFILYFSAMFAPPPLSELFISMLFSINPNRNIRSSSQIRQNSQVFHYSWFIAKWVHVLGKLSNMIRAFPTFCSGEKFPFQTSQSTIQNS